MIAEIFSNKIIVPSSVIDQRNHVNNLSYLQWCLDIAEKHWNKKASTAMQEKYVWFVLQHQISYKAQAFLGDQLLIETWVDSTEGVKSERFYKIIRPIDNKVIVEAKTLWCLLDAKTHKPTSINSEITTLFQK